MRSKLLLLFLLQTLPFAGQTPVQEQQSTEADRIRLGLTLYHGGLALVRDHRRVDLPAGRIRLALEDLSASIRAKTATFLALDGAPLRVLERNVEFDLLSPTSVLAHSLGQPIRFRPDPEGPALLGRLVSVPLAKDILPPPRSPMEAKLDPLPPLWRIANIRRGRFAQAPLAKRDPNVVVALAEGFSSATPAQVSMETLPEGLRARPTLIQNLDLPEPRQAQVQLAYLSDGLQWQAHYVGVLNAAGTRLDLDAKVNLTNGSGTSFRDAELQLVAGEPNQVAWMDQKSTGGENPNPDLGWHSEEILTSLRFDNCEENHLGRPLPSGSLSLWYRDPEGAELPREDSWLEGTPRQEEVRIPAGIPKGLHCSWRRTELRAQGLLGRWRQFLRKPEQRVAIHHHAFETNFLNTRDREVGVEVLVPLAPGWSLAGADHTPLRHHSEGPAGACGHHLQRGSGLGEGSAGGAAAQGRDAAGFPGSLRPNSS